MLEDADLTAARLLSCNARSARCLVASNDSTRAHSGGDARAASSERSAGCRLLWTLSSGSLVFRSHLFSEWYEDRIQPSVHYLPVRLCALV